MNSHELQQLNARQELFHDPQRPRADNDGPHLIVVDDFYADPDRLRAEALSREFFQYSPPLPEQVGAELAGRFTAADPRWLATSLQRYHGVPVNNPQSGFRRAPPEIRSRLSAVVGESVDDVSWPTSGDGWNGAFHLQLAGTSRLPWSIHHHYKPGDVHPRGWSGLVYLSPDAPPAAGTSIWRHIHSGRCVAAEGAVFTRDASEFEQVALIANRYNRLVLFRENVLHRAEPGFGEDLQSGRLTQTFFFITAGRAPC